MALPRCITDTIFIFQVLYGTWYPQTQQLPDLQSTQFTIPSNKATLAKEGKLSYPSKPESHPLMV